MASLSCPICGKRFDPERTPSRPFCSERCRQIDLGRWLSEKYAVPDLREEPEEDNSGLPPSGNDGGANSEEQS